MRDNKAFRLYKFVDSKFQFFGLKMEQLAILLSGILTFFLSEEIMTKVLVVIATSVAFSIQKRLVKRFEGVSLKSYTSWFLGISVGLGAHFPKTSVRRIVGD